jgi:formate dehydrogenase major subunit
MTSPLAAGTFTLDGRQVEFLEDESVLAAARRHGIDIPSLCYDDRLEAFGGCRLCAVSVKGVNGFPASCTTQAQPDMEVETRTPELDDLRRTLLAMVVSENGSEHLAVDPLRGLASQELQEAVTELKPDLDRFQGATSGSSRSDDANPFILRDYDLCISCYRCVRVCAEQEGDYAITVAGRGFGTHISVEFDGHLRESSCTFCGQCVQTCPTGALADRKAMRFAQTEDPIRSPSKKGKRT